VYFSRVVTFWFSAPVSVELDEETAEADGVAVEAVVLAGGGVDDCARSPVPEAIAASRKAVAA
jgi:hypothetical protein